VGVDAVCLHAELIEVDFKKLRRTHCVAKLRVVRGIAREALRRANMLAVLEE
jgi:hypothetical protein